MLRFNSDKAGLGQGAESERALSGAGFLLLDLDTPEEELIRIIRSLKASDADIRVVLLSRDASSEMAALAHELSHTSRQRASAVTKDGPEALTPREREVLSLIGRGIDNEEIAEALCISKRTVEVHTGNIYAKLGFRGRSQAVLYAVQQGLVA